MLTVRLIRPLVALPVGSVKTIPLPAGTVIERYENLPAAGATYVFQSGQRLSVMVGDLIEASEPVKEE
jgi:hypothetical protein